MKLWPKKKEPEETAIPEKMFRFLQLATGPRSKSAIG